MNPRTEFDRTAGAQRGRGRTAQWMDQARSIAPFHPASPVPGAGRRRLATCLLAVFGTLAAWGAESETDTKIQRTWMPDAHPSSFAVGFPCGLNFCFDPVRNEIAYAWEGDYVDLSPTVTGKFPRNAVVRGDLFFEAAADAGFSSTEPGGPPARRFRGYRLEDGVPVFAYEVDGIWVRERISPDSGRRGLVRHFQIEGSETPFVFRPDDPSHLTIESGAGTWVDGEIRFPARTAVEFTVLMPAK